MADDADFASVLEHRVRERSITAHINRPVLRSNNGVCIDCGDSISAQRLAIDPTIPRCITCQTLIEKREATHVRNR